MYRRIKQLNNLLNYDTFYGLSFLSTTVLCTYSPRFFDKVDYNLYKKLNYDFENPVEIFHVDYDGISQEKI